MSRLGTAVGLIAAALANDPPAVPTPAERSVAWWLADYSAEDVGENTLFAKSMVAEGFINGAQFVP